MNTYLREVFYNNPNKRFTLSELARMLNISIERVYSELKNLINRNIVMATWDTSVEPRRRLYYLKKG